MSDGEGGDRTLDEQAHQEKQLRLVGYGIATSGVLTVLVGLVSTSPHGILVFGLGALALAMLVFERTQGGTIGLSLGFLTGSLGVWLWPHLDGGSYSLLGLLLIAVGILNAELSPYFRRFGERMAER